MHIRHASLSVLGCMILLSAAYALLDEERVTPSVPALEPLEPDTRRVPAWRVLPLALGTPQPLLAEVEPEPEELVAPPREVVSESVDTPWRPEVTAAYKVFVQRHHYSMLRDFAISRGDSEIALVDWSNGQQYLGRRSASDPDRAELSMLSRSHGNRSAAEGRPTQIQVASRWADLGLVGFTEREFRQLEPMGETRWNEALGLSFTRYASGQGASRLEVWWNNEWHLAEIVRRGQGIPRCQLVGWEPGARREWLTDLEEQAREGSALDSPVASWMPPAEARGHPGGRPVSPPTNPSGQLRGPVSPVQRGPGPGWRSAPVRFRLQRPPNDAGTPSSRR